jgi:hypothetical protein
MNEITLTPSATRHPLLTAKEQALYNAIAHGMDEPGSGWLHELADESLSTNAVLGSLVKKGLVTSAKIKEKGEPAAYWVTLN